MTRDGERLAEGVAAGDRAALARAITLVESRRTDHRAEADALLAAVLPRTGSAVRVGVTGVPGVGKSTLIDRLGMQLIAAGHRVAVLAVDPSSARSGGSILGDKTRMAQLSRAPQAFVRPSPSSGTLGGVAARTQETILLVEAAGFDTVLVETVGIGQSETAVADLTDVFLVLALPGAGDELQGIKKGVIELADIIAVNKADGDLAGRARTAAAEYRSALGILEPPSPAWRAEVLTVSGQTGAGLAELWDAVLRCRSARARAGELAARRGAQAVRWMWAMVELRLRERLARPGAGADIAAIEAEVAAGRLAPGAAADAVLARMSLAPA